MTRKPNVDPSDLPDAGGATAMVGGSGEPLGFLWAALLLLWLVVVLP